MSAERQVNYCRIEVQAGTSGLLLYRPDREGHMTCTWLTDVNPITPRLEPVDLALTIARLRAWADLLEAAGADGT